MRKLRPIETRYHIPVFRTAAIKEQNFRTLLLYCSHYSTFMTKNYSLYCNYYPLEVIE